MERLVEKVALVTGGASGMGAAIAKRFALEGARVLVADLDERRGAAVAADIGSAARFVPLDVSDPDGWANVDKDIREAEGRLDILVNSAGAIRMGTIEDNSIEDFEYLQSVNAGSVFLACKFAVAIMKETSKSAAIVNILSASSVRPNPQTAAYSASKGAGLNITRVVALHCAEKRYPIRCNSVLPGLIDTPMVRAALGQRQRLEEAIDTLLDHRFPMRRMGTVDEIAAAALFLASDEASYITGANLPVDGGSTAA
ncbi:SDR family oxidoreductase (plasmid) [Sphingobium sp. SJ10-10]|uniref:SDR family NAD(P)-dependent oxidoreductase n=1 Tax=Sphingobium sp. SJ10-10 TaxID=3114999 RepID=UPI002E1899F1|nr:SDR family oxidoreductase [Sphingobium sp. SJ10-10]